jgi:hypothetical protein
MGKARVRSAVGDAPTTSTAPRLRSGPATGCVVAAGPALAGWVLAVLAIRLLWGTLTPRVARAGAPAA